MCFYLTSCFQNPRTDVFVVGSLVEKPCRLPEPFVQTRPQPNPREPAAADGSLQLLVQVGSITYYSELQDVQNRVPLYLSISHCIT